MIRVYFADGAHEDRDENSEAMPSGKGPPHVDSPAMALKDCRPTPFARCAIWAERGGQWVPAFAEARGEQTWRAEAERLRADNARLAALARQDAMLCGEAVDAQVATALKVEALRKTLADEKARADAAEKRLADLRAWADAAHHRNDMLLRRLGPGSQEYGYRQGRTEAFGMMVAWIDAKDRT